MTGLPTDPGVIVIGSCLHDPGPIWGVGTRLDAPRPPGPPAPRPPGPCDLCGGSGWITFPDPFIGGTLDARCPCGGT